MLKFEKTFGNEHLVIYKYICEGKEGNEYVGEIKFSLDEGNITSINKADYDFGWYWGHLASRLRKMYADGKFEDSGMIAWY